MNMIADFTYMQPKNICVHILFPLRRRFHCIF